MVLANLLILFAIAAAAWLGIAAFVQKRAERREREAQRSTNAAS